MPTRLVFSSLLLVLVTAWTAAAQAQTPATPPQAPQPAAQAATAVPGSPTFEVGVGYQVLRAGELCANDSDNNCGPSQTFPLGFAIDAVRNFGALGVVAEVGWSRDSDDIAGNFGDGSSSINVFHYAGGLRWTGHNGSRVWPYGQVLIGGATMHTGLSFDNDADQALEQSDTSTHLILQPGVGLTVVGGDGWGVFGQVDYRRLFLNEDEDGASGRNDVRVLVGLRFILD